MAVYRKFDDNGTLDVWVYDNEYSRFPSVTERDFGQYVDKHILTVSCHSSHSSKVGDEWQRSDLQGLLQP